MRRNILLHKMSDAGLSNLAAAVAAERGRRAKLQRGARASHGGTPRVGVEIDVHPDCQREAHVSDPINAAPQVARRRRPIRIER